MIGDCETHILTCKFVNTADPLKPRDKTRIATTIPLSFMNGIDSNNKPGIMCAYIEKNIKIRMNIEQLLISIY